MPRGLLSYMVAGAVEGASKGAGRALQTGQRIMGQRMLLDERRKWEGEKLRLTEEYAKGREERQAERERGLQQERFGHEIVQGTQERQSREKIAELGRPPIKPETIETDQGIFMVQPDGTVKPLQGPGGEVLRPHTKPTAAQKPEVIDTDQGKYLLMPDGTTKPLTTTGGQHLRAPAEPPTGEIKETDQGLVWIEGKTATVLTVDNKPLHAPPKPGTAQKPEIVETDQGLFVFTGEGQAKPLKSPDGQTLRPLAKSTGKAADPKLVTLEDGQLAVFDGTKITRLIDQATQKPFRAQAKIGGGKGHKPEAVTTDDGRLLLVYDDASVQTPIDPKTKRPVYLARQGEELTPRQKAEIDVLKARFAELTDLMTSTAYGIDPEQLHRLEQERQAIQQRLDILTRGPEALPTPKPPIDFSPLGAGEAAATSPATGSAAPPAAPSQAPAPAAPRVQRGILSQREEELRRQFNVPRGSPLLTPGQITIEPRR